MSDQVPPVPLYDRIQAHIARYPERRSAILGALRLAQEEHGWLSPAAFREVAEAMDLTPAQCQSVASFYDMYYLHPKGVHTVEVCTNIACGIVGAGAVLRAFEDVLGIHAGDTTPDGAITLKSVECLGGCGWGPVVSIDAHYQEHFTPAGAGPLVARLYASPAAPPAETPTTSGGAA
jgi:NADH-quinone oxidoreductase subunit E